MVGDIIQAQLCMYHKVFFLQKFIYNVEVFVRFRLILLRQAADVESIHACCKPTPAVGDKIHLN
jgi:hypothetical protein